jgi:hypothetical protein
MAKTASTGDLIREALERALADPTPRKLHGTKANPGVFLTSSAAAKAAAQQCLQQALIVVCGEQRTKSKVVPLYGLAPAGVAYLLEHDPLQQLLAATQDAVERLIQTGTDCQQTLTRVQQQAVRLQEVIQRAAAQLQPPDLEAMLAAVQTVSSQGQGADRPGPDGRSARVSEPTVGHGASVSGASSSRLADELQQHVQQHQRQSSMRLLEMPQLFRFARSREPALTLGQFHDLVRRLSDAGRIRLSPFTQAMYQLQEPECAMIVGREIMYYVEGV